MDAVLGIDIGKAKFHVTLLFSDGTRRRKACVNSPAGCTELLAWMARHGAARVHACLEATGTYGELLATTLVDAGHQVSILNPAIIHHYAKSRLSRAKTDAVDADVIADYAAKEHPPLWTPLPRDVRELQALVRRLDALIGMQTDERNRAQAGASPPPSSSRSTPSSRTSRADRGGPPADPSAHGSAPRRSESDATSSPAFRGSARPPRRSS